MTRSFQSFETSANPAQGPERVKRLRAWLDEHQLDGFILPRSDEHQGEYVAPRSERLAWLTGFTGSAGSALILKDKALIFVDGRYTTQVREQVDLETFTVESLIETPPHTWLAKHLDAGLTICADPWLHTIGEMRRLKSAAEKRSSTLANAERNPVDAIWSDQPSAPLEPVTLHPLEKAGRLAKEKLAEMATALDAAGADATVLTDPASLAWALNIRGGDVPHTPIALGFAILSAAGAHQLFMDKRKMSVEVEAYLTQLCDIRPPSKLDDAIIELAKAGKRVALDPALAADQLRALVEDNGGTYLAMGDPARLPRACKNDTELAGTRTAHRRDGVAMCRFLAWLDEQPPGTVSEIDAARKLEAERVRIGEETQEPLRDLSFDTISGSGPNGAIIHYRVTTETNRQLQNGELYLVDSGAQFEDGTTDITRTVPIGTPSEEMRVRYTIVLRGMIAISMARFPAGTRGCDLDPLARIGHWKAGIDFAHGTGHGVGAFLSVHEGPQRIAKSGTEPLLAGMILSNEPGYYKEGAYGIRLENLIVVSEPADIAGGEIAMHAFETLTLAPFDRRMTVTAMLTAEERDWLNAYHRRVLSEIGPSVSGETLGWLERACAEV